MLEFHTQFVREAPSAESIVCLRGEARYWRHVSARSLALSQLRGLTSAHDFTYLCSVPTGIGPFFSLASHFTAEAFCQEELSLPAFFLKLAHNAPGSLINSYQQTSHFGSSQWVEDVDSLLRGFQRDEGVLPHEGKDIALVEGENSWLADLGYGRWQESQALLRAPRGKQAAEKSKQQPLQRANEGWGSVSVTTGIGTAHSQALFAAAGEMLSGIYSPRDLSFAQSLCLAIHSWWCGLAASQQKNNHIPDRILILSPFVSLQTHFMFLLANLWPHLRDDKQSHDDVLWGWAPHLTILRAYHQVSVQRTSLLIVDLTALPHSWVYCLWPK